ncbi:MAG: hypothetical protein ABI378_04130 [Chitinophagaceae bacterium]
MNEGGKDFPNGLDFAREDHKLADTSPHLAICIFMLVELLGRMTAILPKQNCLCYTAALSSLKSH